MANGKGTIIGTNKNPIVLGKKKRRPNINSQAYRDNYDRIFGKKDKKWKKAISKRKVSLLPLVTN